MKPPPPKKKKNVKLLFTAYVKATNIATADRETRESRVIDGIVFFPFSRPIRPATSTVTQFD